MKTFEALREEYGEFLYRDHEIAFSGGECTVRFIYEIPGLSEFTTKWVFPTAMAEETPILRELVFSLGLAEAISYYKAVCPEKVKVLCGTLSTVQKAFWEKLFYNGLGEFMYRNGIRVGREELLSIECEEKAESPLHDDRSYEGVLVPVGGGKDSVVSLELLKDEDLYTFSVNENATIRNVIDVCSHKKGNLPTRRILDKKILTLNEQGYLNGHIPFSAVVAFGAVICAYLNGIRHIALSNESSANESTVPGSFVNHQYSKTYEFERDFANYITSVTDSDIHYFSLLRPLSELQIAGLFSAYPAYHKVFRSCNRGSKEGIWCGNCPKCLFVYIILLPFLSEEELEGIFGEKLLDKESLEKDFRELAGIDENKPFECVGTRDEVCACLKDYIGRGGRSLLTDRYREEILKTGGSVDRIMARFYSEHLVPEKFVEKVRAAVNERCSR